MAVKLVSTFPADSMAKLTKMWGEYKVKDSPITAFLLAEPFLRKKTVFDQDRWTAWLSPEPEKFVWWLDRAQSTFEVRFAKAQMDSKKKLVVLRGRAFNYRDPNQSEVFQVSMAWASWQAEMKTLVSEAKMAELSGMFRRGRPPQHSTASSTFEQELGRRDVVHVQVHASRPCLLRPQDLRRNHRRRSEGQEERF